MAYKYSRGARQFGDIKYEDDAAETQIDFEDDFVALKTGGNQVLVVSGSDVGIGISAPTQNLHVVGAGNTTLRIQGSTGYYGALNIKGGTGDSAWVWQPANTSDLRFFTVDDDRMVILGTGNVGIGTTSPDELLTLNATQPTIQFQESETARGEIGINDSDNLVIENKTQNKHIVLKVNDGGVTREGIRVNGAVAAVVVNEGSESLMDFRVESNNDTHMLFVDGGNNVVGVATSTPSSGLHVNSSFATAISVKSSDYTATGDDHTLLVDASNENVTITLPTAVGIGGRMYLIKRVDGSGNAVNIAADGSEEIDGSTNPSSVASLGAATFQSDNANWWKIGQYLLPP
jgi:hypothetical protein